MKKITKILLLSVLLILIIVSIVVVVNNNSSPKHSKSYEAGVAWVRNDFDGANQADCYSSVLVAANATTCTISKDLVVCDSQAASYAVVGYNMQQWIDGCLSVPFKHYPKWLRNYIYNLNN